MNRIQAFLKRKNVLFSANRYGVDAMGAMAQGLFASLLIGTIIKTRGQQLGAQFLVDAGNFAQQVAGPAMAVSIGAERRADGHRHRRSGHLLGKIARVNQKLYAQLLPQCFDNRADQKRGKQPLRHRAHRVHAVALGGKQHVFAFQKCLNPVHRFHLVLLFFQ